MMWNLLSHPTTGLNDRMRHFQGGGVKTYFDPSYIFSVGQDPQPQNPVCSNSNRDWDCVCKRDFLVIFKSSDLHNRSWNPNKRTPRRCWDTVITARTHDWIACKQLCVQRWHLKSNQVKSSQEAFNRWLMSTAPVLQEKQDVNRWAS